MHLPDVLAFVFRDPAWDHIPIGMFKRILSKCHDLHQMELLRAGHEDGPADMLLMWSWLSPEAESRYANGGFSALRPTDIGKEGRLWLIALIAPGGAEHLTAGLAWASANLQDGPDKERFRCLAPLDKQSGPQPVAFIKDGDGRGSINPVHI